MSKAQQLIIDITNKVAPNTQGKPTIVFYKENTWDAACQLERGPNHHELNFGCYLNTLSAKEKGPLTVDTVEHAEKIIEALQLAIQEGWFFTEAQIKKYKTSATDTRGSLIAKIRKDSHGER